MTETTTTTDEAPVVIPDGARRALRIAVAAVLLATAAIAMAGLGLWGWAEEINKRGERNAWDDATRVHDTCVTQSATRTDTITLEHARFERESAAIDRSEGGINSDEATVDLIEANVMFVATADPENPLIKSAQRNIAARRQRLQEDRDSLDVARQQLAAAVVDFDQKRPPLDPAACPPAPRGPRP